MKVLLLGAPGAGKTHRLNSSLLHSAFLKSLPATCSALPSKQALRWVWKQKKIIDEGGLVRDDIIIGMVKERIAQDDCKNGFLFDGFHVHWHKPKPWLKPVDLDAVVEIDVPDSVIVDRMSGRRVHLASGRTYHVTYNPPKVEGKDDVTGEDLIQRDDDKEETVKNALPFTTSKPVLVDFTANWKANTRLNTSKLTAPKQ